MRRALRICLPAAMMLGTARDGSASGYAAEILRDGPAAWWRFDDAASSDGARARDSAGGRHGVYRDGVALEAGPPGVGGRAARFDGRGAHVELPGDAVRGLDTVSVEFWLRSEQEWTRPYWPGSATFVSKATAGNGSGDWTIIGASHPGAGTGCVVAGSGPRPGTDVTCPSRSRLNDGRWHHVVWTRAASGENVLHVDGTAAATAKDAGGSVANGRPIQVGGDPFLEGAFLSGLVAEVAIYDKVLPAERVRAHARAGGLVPRKQSRPSRPASTSAGWTKHPSSPVLGGALGTCFDVAVLPDEGKYRMYFSWRPRKSIALVTSVEGADGVRWSEPAIVLGPNPATGWEDDVNRPVVVKRDGKRDDRRDDGYHMWYTGQAKGRSSIGYATSPDGRTWKRMSDRPVLSPEMPWEKVAVMCPHVIWDEGAGLFRMWYSGGEQYEPDAIGYATSPDGLRWTRFGDGPVFSGDPGTEWERHKVTACQVVKRGDWHLMFYIGFRDVHHAQIGVARQRDGATGWQRHPSNPIIGPDEGAWDHDACYKPYAIFDGAKWLLWYNGRRGSVEQIGLALHEGGDLGFPAVLSPKSFRHHIDSFNRSDRELYPQHVSNAAAWGFLRDTVPLFECPDEDIERTYWFRWWTYRKHLKSTPDGFVVTEFLPDVSWSGKHNTISCPAGHHLYEGRWLRDRRFLDDYSKFWFRGGGEPRRYSFWAADAMWARYLVTGDAALVTELLPDLVGNFEAWERERLDASGLFWQVDDRDGMEVSIGGSGFRATINSYMYGDAVAIARIADLAGRADLASAYRNKAKRLRRLVEERLWDPDARFFKVLPRGGGRLADARELHGYTPWYFGLPGPEKSVAWKQLTDPQGFSAPFGPTTAERRHPRFAVSYEGHECQWNGPSWPYATSVTLTAMARLLNDYKQDVVGRKDYLDLLRTYARSHRLKREDGRVVPWIDENLNPLTGDWISRTRLKSWRNGTWDPGKGGEERGKDYNHSTFCDLVITGLAGLRPRADDVIEVNPLVPEGAWDWFCLDGVPYHGRTLTILYDRTGERYGRGKGLRVLVDGTEVASSRNLGRLEVR